MQGKRILTALSGLAIISAAAPAFAVMMSIPFGWYLEGNVGSSHLSNVNYPGSTNSSGLGGNLNLGYKFMPYVGVEIGYSQFHNSTVKLNNTTAATVKHYSYDMAIRGIVPIVDSGVEAFAKLGAGHITSRVTIKNQTAANTLGINSGSHSATGLYTGIGLQYYFIPEMAVVGQWQRSQGSSSSGTEDMYSIGVSYIFN